MTVIDLDASGQEQRAFVFFAEEDVPRDQPPLRRCARCGQDKPDVLFHNSRTGQFSYCADCRRAYDREYYAQRGRDARRARQRQRQTSVRNWLASLKEDASCADCGGVFPDWVLHWDHLPGHTKVDAISNLARYARRDRVLIELEKCELVCANCHVLRTIARRRHARSD